ncbi:WXG100 family type VII secretion target [Nocardia sp. CA-128927]|uniref:WXG100 family type VII secretion target n=1 Tax=Nocardia sp. CA-128927 TaxID=3239975 RepID=UPI003D991FB1
MSSLPPTKTQIRSWNTAPLQDQALEWGRGVPTITEQHSAISRQLADSPAFWRGDAGDAMRVKGDEAKTSLSKVSEAFEKAGTATAQIAQTLGFAKSTAVNAIAKAEDEKFIVGEDGTVGYSADFLNWVAAENHLTWMAAQSVLYKVAKQHETDIKKALREAGDAAESARQAMDKVFADVPIPPDAELDRILNTYQAEADPGGMVMWPDGALKAAMEVKTLGDFEPQSITVAEAKMLDQLSLAEKIQFYNIKNDAEATAKEVFPGEQDDHADAFRHTYWNARMTQEFGEDWTKEYTSKHEGRPDNAAVREAMDLYNNEVGRNIGLANPNASEAELRGLVQDAVKDGKTVVIDQDEHLNWTNKVQPGNTVNSGSFDEHPFFLPGTPVPDNRPQPK